MVESALAATVFLWLMVGITEAGRLGFAYNSISFAAHRAARYASVRGSSSGHAATAVEVQAQAGTWLVGLDPGQVTTTVLWVSGNGPGGLVEVKVQYGFRTILLPLANGLINLSTVSRQIISQ